MIDPEKAIKLIETHARNLGRANHYITQDGAASYRRRKKILRRAERSSKRIDRYLKDQGPAVVYLRNASLIRNAEATASEALGEVRRFVSVRSTF